MFEARLRWLARMRGHAFPKALSWANLPAEGNRLRESGYNEAFNERLRQRTRNTMTKKGKHTKPAEEAVELDASGMGFLEDDGYFPTAGLAEGAKEKAAKKRKGRRIAAIVCGSIAGAVAVAYLAGVAVFSVLFFPGTYIGDNDISLKSSADIEAMLNDAAANYAFTVEGQGIDLSMTSGEAGISFDTDAIIADMRAETHAWAWPCEVLQTRDFAECVIMRYEGTALEDALRDACAAINETAALPTDATIGYDAAANAMAVIPEQYGTLIDADEVVAYVKEQNNALNERIELPQEVLVEAEVKQDDERLAKAAEAANEYLKTDLDLMMGGVAVASLDPETMSEWIILDESYEVAFSEELMNEWAKQLSADCSTVGAERTYTRPDGKEITVSGGDYGWEVDEAALVAMVQEAVAASQQGEADIPLKQEGVAYNGVGAADWGKRYIDVDLAEQHAYFYDENGEIIWESDFVSGGPGASRATPEGVWDVNQVAGRTTLVGRKSDGTIDYETPVDYWMPFVRKSIGFHDANWRSSFGGSIYTYNGSHGCINLPVDKAKELKGILQVGDVVVTHN